MKEKIAGAPLIVFLLIGIVIAAMNYMGDMSDLEKIQNNKANLVSQLNAKEENLKKAKNASSEIPVLKSEIEQLSLTVSKANELAPKNLSSREVVNYITQEAKVSGVRVTQSKPVDVKSNMMVGKTDPANSLQIEDVGISVELEGSYSQVTFFFHQLAKTKIIIIPKDFDVSVKEILDSQVNLKVKGTLSGVKYAGVRK